MNIEDELRKAAEATETAENNQHHAELMSETMMRAKAQDRLAVTDAAMTQLELKRLRARDAANRAFKRELEGPPQPLDVTSGTELAMRALEAPRWRVDGLMVAEGSTLISAVRKSGKTTLALNLVRSLLTGEPFLGEFAVTPVTGTVAVLNFEVSGPQLGRWAAEAGVPLDRLVVANLRGRRNPLSHDDDRAALALELRTRGVETLIVDPFANAYTEESQNDAGQVARFLHLLSEFARQAVGARDLVLVNHAGWQGDRSRGSSALEDWPDAIVRLTMDAYGARYLSALGRDVDVPEGRLEFDPETRRLTLDRSANKWSVELNTRRDELVDAIVAVVSEVPGVGTRALQDELTSRAVKFAKTAVQPAVDTAVATGRVVRRVEGSKKALYPPAAPSVPSVPQCPAGVPGTVPSVPPLIGAGDGRSLRDVEAGGLERDTLEAAEA